MKHNQHKRHTPIKNRRARRHLYRDHTETPSIRQEQRETQPLNHQKSENQGGKKYDRRLSGTTGRTESDEDPGRIGSETNKQRQNTSDESAQE